MITSRNVIRHELIGLNVEVKGKKGRIIDETKKTIKIEVRDGKETVDRCITKKDNDFYITLPSKQVVKIEGKLLYGKAEERIKKKSLR